MQLTRHSQTDASRARLMEAHIEARVADRLRALQSHEAAAVKDAREKLNAEEAPAAGAAGEDDGRTSYKVSKEIEALRARLDDRKQVKELPEGVEAARSSVVRCLRENDRRPLNCYEEVEKFKAEVRRLEKGWVDKTLS